MSDFDPVIQLIEGDRQLRSLRTENGRLRALLKEIADAVTFSDEAADLQKIADKAFAVEQKGSGDK